MGRVTELSPKPFPNILVLFIHCFGRKVKCITWWYKNLPSIAVRDVTGESVFFRGPCSCKMRSFPLYVLFFIIADILPVSKMNSSNVLIRHLDLPPTVLLTPYFQMDSDNHIISAGYSKACLAITCSAHEVVKCYKCVLLSLFWDEVAMTAQGARQQAIRLLFFKTWQGNRGYISMKIKGLAYFQWVWLPC